MPRRVQGPDGILHEFPDDATDAEISEALSTPPSTARGKPARTWTDTAVDALPMVGGMLGGALGAMSGIPTLGLTSGPAAVAGAGILGAGGEAAKQLINRARGMEAPATPMEAAANIGAQGALQAGSEVVGQGVAKAATSGAKAVYRGFLKPSLAKQSVAKADEIVETALQEWLPVTKAGKERAVTLATDLRGQVDDLLKQADAAGGKVDLSRVANKVRTFARQKYYRAGRPSEDFDAAMRVADAIESHPSLGGVTDVPLTEANKVKRGLDEAIGESNFGVERGATKTAQKEGRRALRQQIEQEAQSVGVGNVGPLNARQGRLLDAARALTRATAREANKSPLIGVNTIVSGAVGGADYARNRDPYMAAAKALTTRALLTPEVATRVAIVAYKLGQNSGAVPANVARVALQAVLETEQQAQDVP